LNETIFSATPSSLGHYNWYQTLASKRHEWLTNALLTRCWNFYVDHLQGFIYSVW
jgi:hypothetical protein